MARADAVFEGGGVKGIALVGALAVAEERGYQWQNVAGTSAGAIVGALVAAGFTASEIKGIMDSLDFKQFRDQDWIDGIPLLGPLASLLFEKGLFEGAFLENLIEELLAQKGVRTFGDLVMPREPGDSEEEYRRKYRYKLRVVASDVSRGRMVVLPQDAISYGADPDGLSVARAVRMSMGIPFFYEPVLLEDEQTHQQSYIVDGGLLSNYPVWLFDSPGIPEWPTLGFRLVEGPEGPKVVRHQISGPASLLMALAFTAMEAHDARYVEDQNWVRTINIPTAGFSAIDFDVTPEGKETLYQTGTASAEKFFERWNFEKYVEEFRRDESKHGRNLVWQQLRS